MVIGTGTMGAGIAQVAALAGCTVHLNDRNPAAVSAAISRISSSLEKSVAGNFLTREEAEAARARLHPAGDLAPAAGCFAIIEAVKEDPSVKAEVFRQIEAAAEPEAWILTNTSMLSISDLARALNCPARFCGLHFFNPVRRMKLVEIIPGRLTDPAVTRGVTDLARRLGKEPVLAPDSPGFIVNRVFDAIKRESLHLLEEGVAPAEIDRALKLGLSFPMGPFELMDLIGLDTTYDCLMNQARQMGRPENFGPVLPALVASGKTGRKAGEGFFTYPTPSST